MYDVKSSRAEDFINDDEINETLLFAEKHKQDKKMIDEILAKAADCKGLSHREALVLLDCELPEEMRASSPLQKRSNRDSTATESSCSRRSIFPTIASTAACIVRIT